MDSICIWLAFFNGVDGVSVLILDPLTSQGIAPNGADSCLEPMKGRPFGIGWDVLAKVELFLLDLWDL